jgi:hypothetical protein
MPIVEDSKLDWAKEIDEKDTGNDQFFCLNLKITWSSFIFYKFYNAKFKLV